METNKENVRKVMAKQRELVPKALWLKRSAEICEWLCMQPMYQNAEVICSYVSFRNEADTWQFNQSVLKDGKCLLLPKVLSKTEMAFFKVTDMQQLKKGYMGIYEPSTACEMKEPDGKRTLMLVPGLAFDRNFHRLGYGGGYYDRYLQRYAEEIQTCGMCFDFQLMEAVPWQPHDHRMDFIVTEKEWIERTDEG